MVGAAGLEPATTCLEVRWIVGEMDRSVETDMDTISSGSSTLDFQRLAEIDVSR
jgi:hypothetical protein